MSTELYNTLSDEVRVREDTHLIQEMDTMTRVYEGELPPEYDQFFPQGVPKQIVGLTRLAWDDLSTTVGKLPELRADPLDLSDEEERRASLLEHIGLSYLRNAEPTGKTLMRMLAWWLVGTGRAVAIVTPDHENKMPRITIRDPRYVYPNPKHSINNIITELTDVIFKYELPIREMENRGLKASPSTSRGSYALQPTQEQKGTIIEYIDDKQWLIVSDGGTVQTAEHNLGIVPAYVFGSFSPNKKALSQFQDQIVFQVAISRLLSQKMRFADRLAHPLLWVRGHEGTVKIGPDVITKLGPQGEMGQLNPPIQLQVDRDIETLQRFARVLNRNPEARQGEVQSKGMYMSAKTLELLSDSIDTVVSGYWDTLSLGCQQLLQACYAMDEKLWPNVEKSISGTIRGQKRRDLYTPAKDIAGRHIVEVNYGYGTGGYQGFLQQVQMNAAKLQSRRGALEQMPGITDVDGKLREIEMESVDEAVQANFQALAAQGQLDLVLLAKLRQQMAKTGKPLFDVILEYEQELHRQAAQAVEQGGADALTVPGEEQLPPEEPDLPSIPPAAMLGM